MEVELSYVSISLYIHIYVYVHYTIFYNIIQYTDSLGLLIQINMQNSFQFRNRVLWLLRIQENSSNKNAPPLNVPDPLVFGKDHFREAISSQTARNAREGMYCLRVSSQCAKNDNSPSHAASRQKKNKKGQFSCYQMLPCFTGIQHWTKT